MRSMTVEQLAELAREVEIKDPIDWGLLTISEEDAYKCLRAVFVTE
jgi:hypothetical protein